MSLKAFLYGWCGKKKVGPPIYDIQAKEQGPGFTCSLKIPGYDYEANCDAESKKDAASAAAEDFCYYLIGLGQLQQSELPGANGAAPASAPPGFQPSGFPAVAPMVHSYATPAQSFGYQQGYPPQQQQHFPQSRPHRKDDAYLEQVAADTAQARGLAHSGNEEDIRTLYEIDLKISQCESLCSDLYKNGHVEKASKLASEILQFAKGQEESIEIDYTKKNSTPLRLMKENEISLGLVRNEDGIFEKAFKPIKCMLLTLAKNGDSGTAHAFADGIASFTKMRLEECLKNVPHEDSKPMTSKQAGVVGSFLAVLGMDIKSPSAAVEVTSSVDVEDNKNI